MKSLKMFATTLLITAAMIGAASAQDQAPSQGSMMGSAGPSGMMGHGFMGPGMMGPGGMGPWMMGWGGSSQAMCNAMASHIDGRLAYIKAELKITQDQESLWSAYAAVARENANMMLTHCSTMMSKRSESKLSLPERLDQHEQLMAAQLDAVRAMNKALKPLYAALSDEQKKTADQMSLGPMGMM